MSYYDRRDPAFVARWLPLLKPATSLWHRSVVRGLERLPGVPLPTKIVTQVLDPIDIAAEFGDDPDVAAVDRRVRREMQAALDGLARERRFPVLG